MIGLIDENEERIAALCRKYHVLKLEVFGSAADGAAFDPKRSDVDLLVEFQATNAMNAADQYFGLLEELEDLLGRRVDLVCAKAMRNPFFIRSVNESRKLLYAA